MFAAMFAFACRSRIFRFNKRNLPCKERQAGRQLHIEQRKDAAGLRSHERRLDIPGLVLQEDDNPNDRLRRDNNS